jgi:hypothetical protein
MDRQPIWYLTEAEYVSEYIKTFETLCNNNLKFNWLFLEKKIL